MSPLATTDTTVTYIGDSVTTDFQFDFPYLDPSHVFVFVNEIPVVASLFAQQVMRVTAPGNGAVVSVERHTPSTPIVSFSDGTVILSDDLLAAEAQARFIAEEARDLAKRGLRFNDALQAYDAKNFKISKVADPVAGDDALNKRSLDAAILALIGTNPLAAYLAQAQALADQVHADRLDFDAHIGTMDADLVTATALAASVAAGPDGAEIARRITAYLGSDDWIGGGSGGATPVAGAHPYWRFSTSTTNPLGSGSVVAFSEIQFRTVAGTPETATGGSAATSGVGASGSPSTTFDGSTAVGQVLFVPGWIEYHYGTAKKVAEVAIPAVSDSILYNSAPVAFTIQYSDDGITYTTAGTFTSATVWASGETRRFSMPVINVGPTQTFTTSGTWTKPGKGKMAFMQTWGGGAGNNGGGGGYNELYIPLISLPNTLGIVVGAGGASGAVGGASAVTGYIWSGGGNPNGGAGGTPAGIAIGDPLYSGGNGSGGAAVYGGGGGNGGTSQHGGGAGVAPGGGGDTSAAGARGEVRITVW